LSLTCGHSLCAECAKNLYKERVIQCPFDKKCYAYDHIREIGQNYALMELIEDENIKNQNQC